MQTFIKHFQFHLKIKIFVKLEVPTIGHLPYLPPYPLGPLETHKTTTKQNAPKISYRS